MTLRTGREAPGDEEWQHISGRWTADERVVTKEVGAAQRRRQLRRGRRWSAPRNPGKHCAGNGGLPTHRPTEKPESVSLCTLSFQLHFSTYMWMESHSSDIWGKPVTSLLVLLLPSHSFIFRKLRLCLQSLTGKVSNFDDCVKLISSTMSKFPTQQQWADGI